MTNELATWLVLGGTYALTTGATLLQPSLAPSNILFGVALPAGRESDPEVLRLKRSYRSGVFGLSALIAAIAAALAVLNGGGSEEELSVWTSALPVAALLLQLAAAGGWFVLSHGRATRLKEERGWAEEEESRGAADLTIRSRQRLAYPLLWFLPHLLVIAISAGAAALFYDRIVDPVILHYNAQGLPDRIEPKSPGAVFGLNLAQLTVLATFLFANYTIGAARLRLAPGAPQEHRDQQVRYRRGMSMLMLLLGLGILVFMGATQAFMLYGSGGQDGVWIGVIGLVPLLLAGGSAFGMMRLGRGRRDAPVPGEDANWKLGAFYWNRNDASVFVEKRSGIGFTLNWAHPFAWLFLLALIVLIIVIPRVVG
ncbi:DUF5808 domain-containing protein [Paenibacillus sp. FSL W8-1187]|uniref:DUF5808 domain-containing protein n=1 Tax=Paenibacillus sp. FSL W8-1187 TaxID=2975339 RepID=UPI0030D7941B